MVQAEMEGCKVERSLWEPELLKVHKFFTELLSMEGKYAVKQSSSRLVGNEENIIMVAYGKCKCGPTPDGIKITATCTMKITFKRSKKALFSFLSQDFTSHDEL